jgi:hypothetical protein
LVGIANGRLTKIVQQKYKCEPKFDRKCGEGKLLDKNIYFWEVKNPINLYSIVPYIGDYVSFSDVYEGEKGKLDLQFWVLKYNLEKAKVQFQQVKKMLEAFEYWFGAYPFYEDGYKLVEAPYLGMEHQSAIAYGNGFQNGYLGGDLSRTFGARAGENITLCVPSGNFGNLTAGLYAMKMGAPIRGFIAATNINKTVPDYLATGDYQTRPSQATISNAMDVGAPSNFERMAAHWPLDEMRQIIRGVSVSDEDTRKTIAAIHDRYGYFLDPHGAVGWKAADGLAGSGLITGPLAVLATAHPAKFAETVEPLTGPIPVPPSLQQVMDREIQTRIIPADISALKEAL